MKQNIKTWLFKLGQYTKIDIVYLTKNGFWSGLNQIISSLLVLFLSVIFGHFLPKEIYGNYKFILSVATVIGSFGLTGMGTSIVQAIAKGEKPDMNKAIKTSLKWGGITIGLSLIVSIYYYLNHNEIVAISLIVAGLGNTIISAYNLYMAILNGHHDFKSLTKLSALSQLITTFGIILVTLYKPSVTNLVIVNFLLMGIMSIINFYISRNKYPIIPDHSQESTLTLNHGKHLSFINAFNAAVNQIDKILIFHFLGAGGLAIYSFAIAIPEQIRGAYKNLFSVALPKLSAKKTDLKQKLHEYNIKLTIITALIIVIYVIVSPWLYRFLFPQYMDSVLYSQLYIVSLITIPGIFFFNTFFSINRQFKVLYQITFIVNICTIILSFILIVRYGIIGAIIENTITWLVNLLVSAIYFYLHKEVRNVNGN